MESNQLSSQNKRQDQQHQSVTQQQTNQRGTTHQPTTTGPLNKSAHVKDNQNRVPQMTQNLNQSNTLIKSTQEKQPQSKSAQSDNGNGNNSGSIPQISRASLIMASNGQQKQQKVTLTGVQVQSTHNQIQSEMQEGVNVPESIQRDTIDKSQMSQRKSVRDSPTVAGFGKIERSPDKLGEKTKSIKVGVPPHSLSSQDRLQLPLKNGRVQQSPNRQTSISQLAAPNNQSTTQPPKIDAKQHPPSAGTESAAKPSQQNTPKHLPIHRAGTLPSGFSKPPSARVTGNARDSTPNNNKESARSSIPNPTNQSQPQAQKMDSFRSKQPPQPCTSRKSQSNKDVIRDQVGDFMSHGNSDLDFNDCLDDEEEDDNDQAMRLNINNSRRGRAVIDDDNNQDEDEDMDNQALRQRQDLTDSQETGSSVSDCNGSSSGDEPEEMYDLKHQAQDQDPEQNPPTSAPNPASEDPNLASTSNIQIGTIDQSQPAHVSGKGVLKNEKPAEELKRMELGGILVYDAYARIQGNQRIQDYQDAHPVVSNCNHNILFTDKEIDRLNILYRPPEPRERDFLSEFDKVLYQRILKFDKNKPLKAPQYTCNVPNLHNLLLFDSRFESGNLRKASKVNNVEYNLWLENDLNTKGHTQWFYYKVKYQADKPAKIQFNILNLAKTYSLYKAGMKPVVFSKRKFEDQAKMNTGAHHKSAFWAEKFGWFRACENIKYQQNDIPRYSSANEKLVVNLNNDKFLCKHNGCGEGVDNYYTLSFEYRFEYADDEVWFAHAVPYTYTDLQTQLKKLDDRKDLQSIMRQELLCTTINGMPVPMLTVTDDVQSYITNEERYKLQYKLSSILKKSFKQKYQQAKKLLKQMSESKGKVANLLEAAFEEEIRSFIESQQENFLFADKAFQDFGNRLVTYMKHHAHKKAIVLTSRVHPGEPQASYMMEGSIQYLVGDSPTVDELRKHFVFIIVPMLNPDGVIQGNYRCSLLGCDLNRKWQHPNKYLHPTIFYTKQIIRYLQWERKVLLYCDMHGHSRKQNAFFFGCSYKNYEQEGRIKNAQLRTIPLLCCHKNPVYSFTGCSFRIEKAKESTGRVVVFREFNIMNSFTLECSFYGVSQTTVLPSDDPGGGDEIKSVRPLSVQDMITVGAQLISVLENYLPREQHKLNAIGGKILTLFYDEFVKFVPAYILKKQEEEQQVQKTLANQNSPSHPKLLIVPKPKNQTNAPNTQNNGPSQQPSKLSVNPVQNPQPFAKPQSLVPHTQLSSQKDPKNQMKKPIIPNTNPVSMSILQQNNKESIQGVGATTDPSDTDGFSQLIQINSKTREEADLNDFENFVQLQVQKVQTENRQHQGQEADAASSGDDEEPDSVRNERQNNDTGKNEAKNKQGTEKKDEKILSKPKKKRKPPIVGGGIDSSKGNHQKGLNQTNNRKPVKGQTAAWYSGTAQQNQPTDNKPPFVSGSKIPNPDPNQNQDTSKRKMPSLVVDICTIDSKNLNQQIPVNNLAQEDQPQQSNRLQYQKQGNSIPQNTNNNNLFYGLQNQQQPYINNQVQNNMQPDFFNERKKLMVYTPRSSTSPTASQAGNFDWFRPGQPQNNNTNEKASNQNQTQVQLGNMKNVQQMQVKGTNSLMANATKDQHLLGLQQNQSKQQQQMSSIQQQQLQNQNPHYNNNQQQQFLSSQHPSSVQNLTLSQHSSPIKPIHSKFRRTLDNSDKSKQNHSTNPDGITAGGIMLKLHNGSARSSADEDSREQYQNEDAIMHGMHGIEGCDDENYNVEGVSDTSDEERLYAKNQLHYLMNQPPQNSKGNRAGYLDHNRKGGRSSGGDTSKYNLNQPSHLSSMQNPKRSKLNPSNQQQQNSQLTIQIKNQNKSNPNQQVQQDYPNQHLQLHQHNLTTNDAASSNHSQSAHSQRRSESKRSIGGTTTHNSNAGNSHRQASATVKRGSNRLIHQNLKKTSNQQLVVNGGKHPSSCDQSKHHFQNQPPHPPKINPLRDPSNQTNQNNPQRDQNNQHMNLREPQNPRDLTLFEQNSSTGMSADQKNLMLMMANQTQSAQQNSQNAQNLQDATFQQQLMMMQQYQNLSATTNQSYSHTQKRNNTFVKLKSIDQKQYDKQTLQNFAAAAAVMASADQGPTASLHAQQQQFRNNFFSQYNNQSHLAATSSITGQNQNIIHGSLNMNSITTSNHSNQQYNLHHYPSHLQHQLQQQQIAQHQVQQSELNLQGKSFKTSTQQQQAAVYSNTTNAIGSSLLSQEAGIGNNGSGSTGQGSQGSQGGLGGQGGQGGKANQRTNRNPRAAIRDLGIGKGSGQIQSTTGQQNQKQFQQFADLEHLQGLQQHMVDQQYQHDQSVQSEYPGPSSLYPHQQHSHQQQQQLLLNQQPLTVVDKNSTGNQLQYNGQSDRYKGVAMTTNPNGSNIKPIKDTPTVQKNTIGPSTTTTANVGNPLDIMMMMNPINIDKNTNTKTSQPTTNLSSQNPNPHRILKVPKSEEKKSVSSYNQMGVNQISQMNPKTHFTNPLQNTATTSSNRGPGGTKKINLQKIINQLKYGINSASGATAFLDEQAQAIVVYNSTKKSSNDLARGNVVGVGVNGNNPKIAPRTNKGNGVGSNSVPRGNAPANVAPQPVSAILQQQQQEQQQYLTNSVHLKYDQQMVNQTQDGSPMKNNSVPAAPLHNTYYKQYNMRSNQQSNLQPQTSHQLNQMNQLNQLNQLPPQYTEQQQQMNSVLSSSCTSDQVNYNNGGSINQQSQQQPQQNQQTGVGLSAAHHSRHRNNTQQQQNNGPHTQKFKQSRKSHILQI